jgi:hypothetical protein
MLCPTATGEVAITVRIIRIAIIVRQFFPVSDMPEGHNPDRTGGDVDVTIGITGVVDIAGGIPEYLAINIRAVIEGKNIDIALRYSLRTDIFRNLLPDVLKNPGRWLDFLRGKETETRNRGLMHPNTHLHRIFPHRRALQACGAHACFWRADVRSDTTRKSMGDIVFFMKMVGSIPDDVNP